MKFVILSRPFVLLRQRSVYNSNRLTVDSDSDDDDGGLGSGVVGCPTK